MKDKIDQEEKIDKVVSATLSEMSFVWDETIDKLKDDNTCFNCKETLDTIKQDDKEEPKINLFKASKTNKGIVAFVSLCDKCKTNLQNNKEDN